MQLHINGEAREFHDGVTCADLVSSLELDVRKIAIERNLEVVPRETFADVRLCEGDNLEIIHFIGGG